MKIWFKIWENTHLLKSETIEDDTEDTRTHKIFHALEEVCLKCGPMIICPNLSTQRN